MSSTDPSSIPLSDRSPAVFTVTLVLLIFSTAFVIARLVSKFGIVKNRTSDDWVTIIAWLFTMGTSVSIIIGARYGLGKPDKDIDPSYILPLKRSIYAFTTLYNPALLTTKTAILILYIRMASAHPFLRYASWFTLAIVDIAGIVLTFLNIFQCRPISSAWKRESGICIDIVSLYLSSAPINILTDLAILLFPLPILTSLRMEFRQKLVLVLTFIVGGFVTIVDIVRIVYLQNALKEQISIDPGAKVTATNRPPNFTWHTSFTLMWSAVEVNVGLMCCCVLVLKPLVMRVVPQVLRRRRGNSVMVGKRSPEDSSRERERVLNSPNSAGISNGVNNDSKESKPISSFTHPLALYEDNEGQSVQKPTLSYHPASPTSPISIQCELQPTNHNVQPGANEEEEDDEGELDFFQMLATSSDVPLSPITVHSFQIPDITVDGPPDTAQVTVPPPPTIDRRPTRKSVLSLKRPFKASAVDNDVPQQAPTQKFSDFVNIGKHKDLTQLDRMEAWWPILFVSTLFFLWGFGYSLIAILNGKIESLLGYSPGQAITLHNAYWLGYLISPPALGYWILSRMGFRSTFIFGLSVYGIGALAFWPSSVLRSYPGFCISNFIIAFGHSMLEISANPFIVLAGPGELAEARLEFSQGIQAVGVVLGPILAEKGLFKNLKAQEGLFNVQWCYLAVSLFVVSLAVVFYYTPLPEVDTDTLEALALQRLENAGLNSRSINSTQLNVPCMRRLRIPLRYILALIGAWTIWLYTGAQESLAYYWNPIHRVIRPQTDAFWDLSIAHALFSIGRFLAAFLCYIGIPPRMILAIHILGGLITTLLMIVLPAGQTHPGTFACLLLILYFESAIFPIVWATGMKNQGKYTFLVVTLMTSACAGGGQFPSITYGVYTLYNGVTNPRRAQWVVFTSWLIMFLIAIWENSMNKVRRWVDPRWSRNRFVPHPNSGSRRGSTSYNNGGTGNDLQRTKSRIEQMEGKFEGWNWTDGLRRPSIAHVEDDYKAQIVHVEHKPHDFDHMLR